MKFFDSHTHVQFAAYDADREVVIERAVDAEVGMINVGTQQDTSKRAVKLAEQYPGLYAAIGLHPIHTEKSFHDVDELGGSEDSKGFTSRGEIFSFDNYLALAEHPKTVAIGECGLDYFRLSEETKVKQQEAFVGQIELAKKVGKPLMIHCRDAFPDLIALLTSHLSLLPSPPGVIHFFTGTLKEAKQLLEMGFAFTFGGAITFPPKKNQSEGSYDAVIRMLPLDRILSETDAPYVAPVPYRGKRNEPAYVVEVVKRLAALKGISPEEMATITVANAKRIFGV